MSQIRNFFLVLFLCISFQNCGWAVDLFFPLEADKILGKQFYEAAIHGEEGVKVLENEGLRKYVQSIVDRILKSPSIQYKNEFSYQVTILKDDEIINAVCAPGGYIFVYTGLLKFVKDEATLAGILAHEIAHAEKRHSTKQLSTNVVIYFALYSILSYVLGPDLAEHAAQIAGLSTSLLSLANSRSAEEEADDLGFGYILATPYHPGAIADFFAEIKIWREGHAGQAEENLPLGRYLSSHPLDEERIEDNAKRLKKAGVLAPKKDSLFKERYRSKMEMYLFKGAE